MSGCEKTSAIGGTIVIGRKPENAARTFRFDLSEYFTQWPDSAPKLMIQRQGDSETYIAKTESDGDGILWTVSRYDTEKVGFGTAWIVFFGDDQEQLGISEPITIRVMDGPINIDGSEPPETSIPWVQAVIEAADRAEAAAERAENAGGESGTGTGLPEGGVFKDALMINHEGNPYWQHAYWMQMWNEWDGFGVRVESGKSLLDTMKTLDLGLYSVYVKRGMPDNPPGAAAIDSSLRGIIGVTTAKGDACYGWILLWDQDANCYMRYIRSGAASEWKQLNVPIDPTLTVEGAAADAKATGDALAGKLDADKLQEATDAALAQARDSGEFNGKDGAPGQDGKDGQDGAQGEKGVDGVSPIVTLEREEDGVRIGVRDAEGEKSAKVYDGANGEGGTETAPVLLADETIEVAEGETLNAYVKEFDGRYRRIAAMMYMPDAVGGAKYINIWNEDVEPIKSAQASKSICYISGTHNIVAFDIETTGTFLDGKVGAGPSTNNGYTTSYMLVNKLTRNDHIDAVYAMKYITGFSICFAVPSGTRVVVYGWPYEGSDEA